MRSLVSLTATLAMPPSSCLTVSAADVPPVIISVPVGPASVGLVWQYQLIVQGGTDPLTYLPTSFPQSMSVNASGLISWTPASNQVTSNQSVTVTVMDSDGVSTLQTFSLAVNATNTDGKPLINSNAPTTDQLGQQYVYYVQATDPDGNKLTYGLAGTPPTGMQINTSTGVLQWTPSQLAVIPSRSRSPALAARRRNRSPSMSSARSRRATEHHIGTSAKRPGRSAIGLQPEGNRSAEPELELEPRSVTHRHDHRSTSWYPAMDSDRLSNRQPDCRGPADRCDRAIHDPDFHSERDRCGLTPRLHHQSRCSRHRGPALHLPGRRVDPAGFPLTFSLDQKVGNMQIDPNTGLLLWTPASSGTDSVIVRVTDLVTGLFALQPFQVTVAAAQHPLRRW